MRRQSGVSAAAALVFFIGLLGYLAARQAVSDFYTQTVSLEIESWNQPGHSFRGDELTSAIASIDRGLEVASGNAWALEQKGALKLGQVRGATDPVIAVEAARAALVNFRLALLRRPTSPFSWSNLAVAKLYLGEIDAELFDALAHAAEFGPWEPQAQLSALPVGLAAWNQANAAQREMILGIRDRAVMRNPEKVNEIAKGFNRLDLMCDRKKPKSTGGRPCPRESA